MFKASFTLIELLIVIIILGIIAGIGIPGYVKTRESSLDREAKAALKIVQAAEDSYYLETGEYYLNGSNFFNCWDINTLNDNLVLRLDGDNWGYCTTFNPSGFAAFAARQDYQPGGTIRLWRIFPTDKEACCVQGCDQSAAKPVCP